MFEFADPENPIIRAIIVSMFCTEMKLCLFECLVFAGMGNFLDFCKK